MAIREELASGVNLEVREHVSSSFLMVAFTKITVHCGASCSADDFDSLRPDFKYPVPVLLAGFIFCVA